MLVLLIGWGQLGDVPVVEETDIEMVPVANEGNMVLDHFLDEFRNTHLIVEELLESRFVNSFLGLVLLFDKEFVAFRGFDGELKLLEIWFFGFVSENKVVFLLHISQDDFGMEIHHCFLPLLKHPQQILFHLPEHNLILRTQELKIIHPPLRQPLRDLLNRLLPLRQPSAIHPIPKHLIPIHLIPSQELQTISITNKQIPSVLPLRITPCINIVAMSLVHSILVLKAGETELEDREVG